MQTAERAAVVGSPDLESLTTSHIERAFLTVRQELKRFLILYDIYCLMLLKDCRKAVVFADRPPPLSVARALDAILPGVSIRESRFPISMS
jgi:hypothetical protein